MSSRPVDSERILTQLRAEGYAIAPSYEEADLVVVKNPVNPAVNPVNPVYFSF